MSTKNNTTKLKEKQYHHFLSSGFFKRNMINIANNIIYFIKNIIITFF